MPGNISNPLHVAVTGAAGQIAYSLLRSFCDGSVFGAEQPIILQLLDIPEALNAVQGVVMELEDCALPLLANAIVTASPSEAFANADYVVMLGAMPRKEGMDRSDLLKANVGIFKTQGEAIDKVAKKTAKILVVGNPANTNALVCQHFAPSIPACNFSALTRLDQNRACSLLARKAKVSIENIRNVIIWGNHSNTQYPDVSAAQVKDSPNGSGKYVPVAKIYNDSAFIEGEFIKNVSLRGGAIIAARKLSSAMSAAKAIGDHLRDWHQGTATGSFVSMAVISDGSYDVPKGLMFSFPVTVDPATKNWKIVQSLEISAFAQKKLNETTSELEAEKRDAFLHVKGTASL